MLQTFFTEHHGVRRSFDLRKTSLVFVQPGATVMSFWIRVYYQTFRSCLVLTSLLNRMMRQVIVHHKQLCFCVFMCQSLWNQKIGRRIAQTWNRWTIRSGEHSNSVFTIVIAFKTLNEVLQTCWEQIGQDVIDHAIGQFIRLLLQLVEDTLSTALTNVFGAACTLSYLCVLL